MLEVAALTVIVLLGWATVSVAFIAIKAVLWLVLLPLRFLFDIAFLPFLLLKMLVGGILLAVVAPILALAGVIGALVLAAAVIAPLLPLILVGLAVWVIVRLSRAASPTTA